MKRKYWYWVDCLGTDIVMMLFSMILPAYENWHCFLSELIQSLSRDHFTYALFHILFYQ